MIFGDCNYIQVCILQMYRMCPSFVFQVCPSEFFPCRGGDIACVPQEYRCDCKQDCSDGSDEGGEWALCSEAMLYYCANNEATGTSVYRYNIILATLVGLVTFHHIDNSIYNVSAKQLVVTI